jgi:hypothetical protein
MTGLVIAIACLLFLPAFLYIVVPLFLLCVLLIRRILFPRKYRQVTAGPEFITSQLKA